MRNPMLPLSLMSNDGSLQHKPTMEPAGLDYCSRPIPESGKVRFQAVRWAGFGCSWPKVERRLSGKSLS